MATAISGRPLPTAAEAWAESDIPVAPRSYLADVRGRLARNWAAVLSGVVLTVLIVACACADLIPP